MPKKAVPEHHTLSDDSSSIYGSSGDEQSDGLYDDSPYVVDEDLHQCYICGFAFYSRIYSNDRYTNDTGKCQISGVAIPLENRGPFHVPWKKADGLLDRPRDDTERKKTIRPIIPVRGKDQSQILEDYDDDEDEYRVSTEWVGYPVHARCWELLTHHQLGFVAEKNMEDVMQAMRKRHDQKMWKRVFGLPDEWSDGKWLRFSCIPIHTTY
ncbi:hypothetical protein ASPNIDRAFT_44139 [Aspergillus niger ATCC 1015]|uniref:Uncharacterized protein n=1 Tax=Aspergillus niger (strain ATCC 1015 / CBS 113.46 / FGSC A1144 / LSHB Ac4 / NCTC 3858a / NRRL 328 / USDA 3528.7) TaxID=380704 RepID=G3Y8T5_ASPNA|nr:hypothetical protein ASPNIDRAFT_44139 [Aspergillus niger ATCC 1015]